MGKVFSQVLNLLWRVIEIPARYIFGRDIFISYSRRDASVYAPNLILALQKKRPKLSVYHDKWIAPPSGKLPASLRMQLKLSSMLVVICTPGAVKSKSVKEEIGIFSQRRRKIIIINVEDSFLTLSDEKDLWPMIAGISPEREEFDAIKNSTPSENVIERILKSVEFTTQDRRLRRSVWATACFLALSIGGTILYSTNIIKKATTEAQKQKAIGNVRRMVNESGFLLDQSYDSIFKSTVQVLEAAKISDSIGEHILEVDKALRNNIGLLPILLDTLNPGKSNIFSSNLEYTANRVTTEAEYDSIKIKKTDSSGILATITCRSKDNLVALSNDGNRVVFATDDDPSVFKIIDVRSQRKWQIIPFDEKLSIYETAISPDGRFLLIGYWNNHDQERVPGGNMLPMQAEIWDIESQKFIAELNTKGDIQITSVGFSPSGKQVVIGGVGFGYLGSGEGGKALIWEFYPDRKFKKISTEDFVSPRVFEYGTYMNDVSISDDGRFLATSKQKTVYVWQHSETLGFKLVTCIALGQICESHSIDRYNELSLITRNPKHYSKNFPFKKSRWQFNCYPGIRIGHEMLIENFAFQESDSSFITIDISDLPLKSKIRKTNLRDGTPQPFDGSMKIANLPRFLVYDYNDTVEVWDLREGKEQNLPIETGFETVGQPFFSANGLFMCRLVWNEDSSSLLFYKNNQDQYTKINNWKVAHHPVNTSIFLNPDLDLIIISEIGVGTSMYNMTNGKEITPDSIKEIKSIHSSNISKDGKYLAIASFDEDEDGDESGFNKLHLWDLEQQKLVKKFSSDNRISTYEFSPRCSYLAVGNKSGSVHKLNLKTFYEDSVQNTYAITSLSFSNDEKYMAIGDNSGLIRVWNLASNNEISHLQYSSEIKGIAIDDVNQFIAVNCADSWNGAIEEGQYFVFISSLNQKNLIQEGQKRLNSLMIFK